MLKLLLHPSLPYLGALIWCVALTLLLLDTPAYLKYTIPVAGAVLALIVIDKAQTHLRPPHHVRHKQ